jgi:hypothetical protein
MEKVRIEIHLPREVAQLIEEQARTHNNSRKAYIELLCINQVKFKKQTAK